MSNVSEQTAPSGNTSTATSPMQPNPQGAPMTGAPPAQGHGGPVPTGVVTGPGGQKAVFMSEADYFAQANKESHGFATGVLLVGALGACALAGLGAAKLGGANAAMGAAIFMVVCMLIFSCVNFVAGWIVGKMFGTDYGSFGVMVLRFSAVTAAAMCVMQGASLVVGPMVALLISTPIMMILAVILVGMDMMQAFLFTIIGTMLEWLLFAFVVMSIASMIAM
jgi:hypothetical protein